MTATRPTFADQVTTACCRALLDLIDAHHLPTPLSIDPSRILTDRLVVSVHSADLPAWLDAVVVDDDRAVAVVRGDSQYAYQYVAARIPGDDVPIQLRSSVRVEVAS